MMISCNNKHGENDYSKDFYQTIIKSGITLRHDSLILPQNANNEIILIPTVLTKNKPYCFSNQNGLEITLKRINYTTIIFELKQTKIIDEGIATLRPEFYLGAESVGTKNDEFWVTYYDICKSKENLLKAIKIGNQSLSDDSIREVYAFVDINQNDRNNKIVDNGELWKLKRQK